MNKYIHTPDNPIQCPDDLPDYFGQDLSDPDADYDNFQTYADKYPGDLVQDCASVAPHPLAGVFAGFNDVFGKPKRIEPVRDYSKGDGKNDMEQREINCGGWYSQLGR
jgi:hypothetical protein